MAEKKMGSTERKGRRKERKKEKKWGGRKKRGDP